MDLKRIPNLNKITRDAQGPALGRAGHDHRGGGASLPSAPQYPVLAEAAGSIATIQIRNVGTVGGNLCQRPRCWYYRNEHIVCLKKGGTQVLRRAGQRGKQVQRHPGRRPVLHRPSVRPGPCSLVPECRLDHCRPGRQDAAAAAVAEFFTLPSEGGRHARERAEAGRTRDGGLRAGLAAGVAQHLSEVPRKELAGLGACPRSRWRWRPTAAWSRQRRVVLGGVAPIPWHAPAAEAALRGKPLNEGDDPGRRPSRHRGREAAVAEWVQSAADADAGPPRGGRPGRRPAPGVRGREWEASHERGQHGRHRRRKRTSWKARCAATCGAKSISFCESHAR